jgi:hypothetical protein
MMVMHSDLNRAARSCGNLGLLCESAGEILEVDVLDEGVVLSLGALLLILLPGDSDSDAVGEVANSL